MRTTLKLDSDVAAMARRVQREHGRSFNAIVNEALRQGLPTIATPSNRSCVYRTPTVNLGRCLIGSLDHVAEALAGTPGGGSPNPKGPVDGQDDGGGLQ